MAIQIQRREFIFTLGSMLVAPPHALQAQQADKVRRVGALMADAENDPQGQAFAAALQGGLREYGWTEGGNLQITWRWAGGDIGRFRDYAAELVGLTPDLLFAVGTSSVAMLKEATRSIPIIFAIVNDPVAQGFISSMAHPGGNITGFSFLEYSTLGKSLEMLKEVAPQLIRVAVMFNPDTYPYYNIFLRSFEAPARKVGIELQAGQVRTPVEIEEVIGKLSEQPGNGLLVAPDPFTATHRAAIIRSAAHHRIPAVCSFRRYVQEGALMSYGADPVDIVRRAGSYVDRVLKGAKPSELPAQQPTKFELAINLKTAHALNLTVPSDLLVAADEVIE